MEQLLLLLLHYLAIVSIREVAILCRQFLQRVSIACYAERCISHDRFCLTV